MIGKKLRLCTICARGGSKGVKNKNVRELLGKPLIAHTLETAKGVGIFDAIAVSSDSDAILEVSKNWGADHLIKRPARMASDEAPKLETIQHCAAEVERRTGVAYDIFVDLDATAPFRSVGDVRSAVRLLEEKNAPNVITGAPARKSPYFNLVEADENGLVRLSKPGVGVVRRQDGPRCYDMNASIYVWRRDAFFGSQTLFNPATLLYVMPEERSVEIDNEMDFEIAEFLGKKQLLSSRPSPSS